jgi:hypothetical protein
MKIVVVRIFRPEIAILSNLSKIGRKKIVVMLSPKLNVTGGLGRLGCGSIKIWQISQENSKKISLKKKQ